jgi:erythromycin esterase-like protein
MNEMLKQERNRLRDKDVFIEEMNSILIYEIPTAFDEDASKNLLASLAKSRLLIMGEMHGVKENVDVIYTLFKKFGFRQLALEWETGLRAVTEHFIETGEIDFEAIQNSSDGRITAGHFALLKKLKDEGLLERLICFDGSGEADWDARDENMAKNILAGLSDFPTLVVAGNLHAKVEPVTFNDEQTEHHPMGERIKVRIPEVPSGKIEYLSGQYHNFGTQNFWEDPEQKKTGARFYLTEDGLYTFVLPEATAALVPNPSERL